MIEDRLIAQLFATFLRGRGPLPLLRKACASLFPSPSTAESGFNRSQTQFTRQSMSEEALRETAGNKQKAAQALGLSRQGLIKKDEEVETQLVVWSRPRKFCFGR